MKVSELKLEMDAMFKQVNHRFTQVDGRFEEIDRRFEQVDRRFEQIDRRFEEIDRRFEQVDERFRQMQAQIAHEAAATRRHFDVAVEGIRSEFAVISAGVAENTRLLIENRSEHTTFTGILDDHELRLKSLEHYRRKA